jgi:hypothetical protein
MARKKKTEEVKSETVKQEQKPERKGGHIFYSVHSKSRGGFIAEYLDPDKACETVDALWFEYRRNLMNGKWERRVFDVYIMKRDTGINYTNCQGYDYHPGSLAEARREAKLRERYGDDYREDEDMDNFDSSKYM